MNDATPGTTTTRADSAAELALLERLSAAEARFRALLEQVPSGILLFDTATRVTDCNDAMAHILRTSRERLLGADLLDYASPLLFAAMRSALAGEAAGFEGPYETPSGQARLWLSLRMSAVRDAGGHVVGAMAVVTDKTEQYEDEAERQRVEAELREAHKMEAIGRLAGGIAHDFNNLLAVIVTSSAMLLEGPLDSDDAREDVRMIREAADRAATLTRQLLAFGLREVVDLAAIDLNALLTEMEPALRALLPKSVDVALGLRATRATLRADRGQVEQAIVSLVTNARDAMPRGGALAIETDDAESPSGERLVRLTVRDSGEGIDETVRARIFEPFFTTKAAGKGTGLGLSTVYGFVKQMGGAIRADSQRGAGATFTVDLPFVARSEPASAPRVARAAPRGTETILIVEDEDLVRKVARSVLVRCGYRVLEATSGEEAIALVTQHAQNAQSAREPAGEGAIRLVLTDVVMPGMSGPELSARLATIAPGARCLFMSGYTRDQLGKDGRIAEGTPFLAKPFTPDALARKVRKLLDLPQRRR